MFVVKEALGSHGGRAREPSPGAFCSGGLRGDGGPQEECHVSLGALAGGMVSEEADSGGCPRLKLDHPRRNLAPPARRTPSRPSATPSPPQGASLSFCRPPASDNMGRRSTLITPTSLCSLPGQAGQPSRSYLCTVRGRSRGLPNTCPGSRK